MARLKLSAFICLVLFLQSFALPIVSLNIKERAGIARLDEPILMGVPLPEGLNLTDPSYFTLRDGSNNIIPCEFRIAATWLKHPAAIRWLHLDFTLDQLAANASTNVVLHAEPAPYTMTSALSVTDLTDRLEVNTGVIRFRVRKAGFNLFDEAWVDESGAANYTAQNRIIAPHNRGIVHLKGAVEYLSSLDTASKAVVERQGAHCIVIKATGALRNAAGDTSFNFITRLYAYSGSRDVKVVTVVENHNQDIRTFLPVNDLYSEVPLILGQSMTASLGIPGGSLDTSIASGDTAYGTVARSGGNFSPFAFVTGGKVRATSLDPRTVKPKDIGWVSLYDGTRGAGVARKYFWEMFPSSMEARNGSLISGFYSFRQNQPFEFYSGVSRSFETRYVFFNNDEPAEQRSRLVGAMNRLYAIAPASWYCRVTKSLGPVSEKDTALFTSTVKSQLAPAETKMTTNFSNLIAYTGTFPKYGNYNYGFQRWGDDLHYVWDFVPGAGLQADWNLAWNGNYYGLDIMSFVRFIRTSDPVILDYCAAHALQVEDVHQVHFDPTDFNTGGCRYCPATNQIAADGLQDMISIENASHHKTEGLFASYYLLGSERSLQVALEGAKWIRIRFGYSFSQPGENLDTYVRRVSNQLLSQAAAYLHTKDRAYHANMYQNWFFLKRDIQNNETIGFKWQMGLLFEALVNMYYVCDDSIADSIPKYLKIQGDRDYGVVDDNTTLGYAFLSRFYGNSYLTMALNKLGGLSTTFNNYHKDLALSARNIERSFYYFAIRDSVDNPPLPDVSTENPDAGLPAKAALRVSPNPFSGQAQIVLSAGLSSVNTRVHIFTLSGRKVAEARRVKSGEWLWNTAGVAAGVYVVQVTDGKKRHDARTVVLEK